MDRSLVIDHGAQAAVSLPIRAHAQIAFCW